MDSPHSTRRNSENHSYDDEFRKSTDDVLIENLLNDDTEPTSQLNTSRTETDTLPTSNLIKSQHSNPSKPTSSRSNKSNASTLNKAVSSQISNLTATINELSKQVENAEYRRNIAEKEAESRKATIEKLKSLHSKALEDVNESISHLTMRNQQINSLKETVKSLQQQLQDAVAEKQTVDLKRVHSEEMVTSKMTEIERLQHELEASMEDLNQHPAFLKVRKQNEELHKAVNMEKEGRIAALAAWQKMEKQIKGMESKYAEKESAYLKDVRDLRVKHEEIQQQLRWSDQKLEAAQDSMKTVQSDFKMAQEDNLDLKMRLNSMETRMGSQAALEQMKSKNLIDSAMTEMKWREHLLIQQLEKLKQELNREQIQKFKVQKALRTMEVSEIGHQQMQQRRVQAEPSQNTAIVKRKFAELSELDTEINKLKREINLNAKSPIRPDKWIRNPPQPMYLQSPMPAIHSHAQQPMHQHQHHQHQQFQNFQSPQQPVMGNHQMFASPMRNTAPQGPFASPMNPNVHQNGGGIYYEDSNLRIRDAMQRKSMTKYTSPMKGGKGRMRKGSMASIASNGKNAEIRSPRNDADNFWSDLTDHPAKTLQKFDNQFNQQYAESDKAHLQKRATRRKSGNRRGHSHRTSDDVKPRKRRATHPKSKRLSDAELPRWR